MHLIFGNIQMFFSDNSYVSDAWPCVFMCHHWYRGLCIQVDYCCHTPTIKNILTRLIFDDDVAVWNKVDCVCVCVWACGCACELVQVLLNTVVLLLFFLLCHCLAIATFRLYSVPYRNSVNSYSPYTRTDSFQCRFICFQHLQGWQIHARTHTVQSCTYPSLFYTTQKPALMKQFKNWSANRLGIKHK